VISVGLVGIAGSDSSSEASSTVRAYLGDQAQVTARAGSVTIDADSTTRSRADGTGLTAGAIAVSFTDIRSDINSTVSAFTESGGSIDADSVSIISKSTTDLDVAADGTIGGAVAVGFMEPVANATNRNSAGIGDGTMITAQQDFTLRADSDNDVDADGSGTTGGAVAIVEATTTLTVDDQTTTDVGAGAVVDAKEDVTVEAVMRTEADAGAESDAAGLGVGSDATANTTFLGSTTTTVRGTLSGERVTVKARVAEIDLDADSDTGADAGVPITAATSTTTSTSTAMVTIVSGALIRGEGEVDILALHQVVDTRSDATSEANGLGGESDATATTTQTTLSNVTGQSNADVRTRDLLVQAEAPFSPTFSASATKDGFVLIDTGDASVNPTLDLTRTIVFDTMITMLGARSPDVEIGPNGEVLRKINATLNGDTLAEGDTVPGTQVVLDDIRNDDPPRPGTSCCSSRLRSTTARPRTTSRRSRPSPGPRA
jgi:hypothetical protein